MEATTRPQATIGEAARASRRHAWIDNLRVVVITGVIGAHVSLIYALDVGWYYEERTASDLTKAVLAGVFAPGLLFGMGLLFFVAGLFTPQAFERKGARRFAVDRLWRLGVPVLAYLFLVNPAMEIFGDWAVGSREGVADHLRHAYWNDVAFGVAWFIAALLVFSLAYAAWRSRHPAPIDGAEPLRRGDLVKAASFIAAASFAVRLAWPFLDTDQLAGMNVWEYPQMVTLFALGAMAAERGWFADGLPAELRRTCARSAALGVALAMLVGVYITMTDDADAFLGGLRPEATLIPVVEGTIAVGMSVWAADWFLRHWNRAGTLVRGLGRASFAAYLVHAPVTIVLGAALRDLGVPVEVKFVAVFVLAVVASFALGSLLVRSRVGGRVL